MRIPCDSFMHSISLMCVSCGPPVRVLWPLCEPPVYLYEACGCNVRALCVRYMDFTCSLMRVMGRPHACALGILCVPSVWLTRVSFYLMCVVCAFCAFYVPCASLDLMHAFCELCACPL